MDNILLDFDRVKILEPHEVESVFITRKHEETLVAKN